MTQIDAFLKRHSSVGFDANILIGLIEANLEYGKAARGIFQAFERHNNRVWTSVITIPEVLSKPISQGAQNVVRDYEERLYSSPILFAEVTLSIARTASSLGGQYKLKVRDALHIASLMAYGATGFITADKDFESITDLEVFLVK